MNRTFCRILAHLPEPLALIVGDYILPLTYYDTWDILDAGCMEMWGHQEPSMDDIEHVLNNGDADLARSLHANLKSAVMTGGSVSWSGIGEVIPLAKQYGLNDIIETIRQHADAWSIERYLAEWPTDGSRDLTKDLETFEVVITCAAVTRRMLGETLVKRSWPLRPWNIIQQRLKQLADLSP